MKSNKVISTKKSDSPGRNKSISPETLVQLINQGKATYTSIEKIKFLNFALIDYLAGLKRGKMPLIVDVRDEKDNPYLNIKMLYRFLSYVDSVDYIVDKSLHNYFNSKHADESFFSNTFFIGEEMNAITEERICNMKSFFRKSYKKCKIEHPKYIPQPQLIEKIRALQNKKKTVALISGVFDIIHDGHISLLEKAAKSADVLIILINSDYSASRQAKNLRGDRPIHSLEERITTLSALTMIDHISAFDSATIVPILESVSNIVFVKTEKDITTASIKHEMEVVLESKGKNVVVPLSTLDSGSELSSSAIIKASRKKTFADFNFSANEAWSAMAAKRLIETVTVIKKTTNINKFLNLKKLLYKRHLKSKEDRAALELRAILKIISLTRELIKEFSLAKEYYAYLIPYILGKLLHFNLKIVAIQYNKPGLPFGMANAVQLIDGKIVFFSFQKGILTPPFVFEDHFSKVMPHSTQYLAKDLINTFASRIYAYPVKLHIKALSMQILLQDLQENPAKINQVKRELEGVCKDIWEVLEETPSPILPIKNLKPFRVNFEKTWPSIVAHGGVTTLATADNYYAENSRSSIIKALKSGIDVIEIDISSCKNGWVVSHHQKLEIGTMATGLLKDKKIQEVKNIRIRLSCGKPSQEMMITVSEALDIIATARINDPRQTYVKIDVKFSDKNLEEKLVKIIKKSGIPYQKILMTSNLVGFNSRMHKLFPQLPFEFNTVETNSYLLSYGLMDQKIMPGLYLNYIARYAPLLNARTVSLAQFALNSWGENVSRTLIDTLHNLGYTVQLWVASSLEEYQKDLSLGADYVLMQDPKVIYQVLAYKNSFTLLKEDIQKVFSLHAFKDKLMLAR